LLCCAASPGATRGPLGVLLLVGEGAFLLITPTWLPHRATGFTAAPVALPVGGAMGRVTALVRAKPARIAVAVAAAGALLVYTSG